MDEFQEELEDDDDEAVNAPLDVRFVIAGLLMLVSGLFTLALSGNFYIKSAGALCFFASFFVVLKKDKRNRLP